MITMRKLYIFAIAMLALPALSYAQDSTGLSRGVQPIEPSRLQGPREASEEEKEYARQMEEDRQQQQQIDYSLPAVDENGQVVTPTTSYYYPYWGGWGWNRWALHKGLNVNLSASAFVTSGGHGYGTHGGLTQDVSLMYVTNLSKKATLAVGGYFNNMQYRGDNYTTAGFSALFGYQFDEHWSAYAFVQKAFNSNNFGPYYSGYYSPYGGFYNPYGYYSGWDDFGYAGTAMAPWNSRFMDRVGGGVNYQWGKHGQNSITIQFEYDHMPNRNRGYNYSRYDYPVPQP